MFIQAETSHSSAHRLPKFRWSWLLALLFACKALYMGFYVTPPGDIPDESGHYAYAKDIANGDLFPRMYEAKIPHDLWMDTGFTSEVLRENYITQHPPLYYSLVAIPLKITQLFTDDRWYHIRAARTISAISLGLLVLVVFKTLMDAGIGAPRSILLASTLGFIPMVSHLASGITNDIFLFLLCALATRYLVRFVRHHSLRDAYVCAIWLTLAGGTKMTAWVLIAGFVGILVYELRGPIRRWFAHAVGLTATALVLPVWWMARNIFHFGDALEMNVLKTPPKMPDYTLLEYIQNQPYFDWMLVHFYGLIGFSGYCQTPSLLSFCAGVKSTRISSQPYEFMVVVLFILTVAFVLYTFQRLRVLTTATPPHGPPASMQQWVAQHLHGRSLRTTLLGSLLVAAVGVFAFIVFHAHQEPGWVAEIAKVMMVAASLIGILGLGVVLLESDPDERLMYYAMILFMGFGWMILLQGLKAYVLLGEMRGVQGRYFYPFLTLMTVAVALLLKRLKLPTVVYVWIVLVLAWGEFHAYTTQVIPFFERVKI